MELSEKVKVIRLRLDLSQVEVAEEMGWKKPDGTGDNSSVSRAENGQSLERAVQLAWHYIRKHGIERSFFFVDQLPERVEELERRQDEQEKQMDAMWEKLEHLLRIVKK